MKGLVFLLLLLPGLAFGATNTGWQDVTEVDGEIAVFYKTVSGTPQIVVYGRGPGDSSPAPLCLLSPTNTRCIFSGPMEDVYGTLISAGSAEVSWCGRVAP